MEATRIQDLLQNELKRRQKKNPAYSLRAFAKSLRISPAQLSQLASGKRSLTLKTLNKISRELALSPLEKKSVLDSLSPFPREEAPVTLLREDQFRTIADWHHFAILSLTKIRGARKDPVWIGKRLGIPAPQAREALERLERLGLLAKGKEFRQLTEPLRVITEVPSDAIQRSHQQHLTLASERLTAVPLELRDYSSMTMAIDVRNLARARKVIADFQDELVRLLEKGQPTEVYTLACQLFPVTQIKEDEGEARA